MALNCNANGLCDRLHLHKPCGIRIRRRDNYQSTVDRLEQGIILHHAPCGTTHIPGAPTCAWFWEEDKPWDEFTGAHELLWRKWSPAVVSRAWPQDQSRNDKAVCHDFTSAPMRFACALTEYDVTKPVRTSTPMRYASTLTKSAIRNDESSRVLLVILELFCLYLSAYIQTNVCKMMKPLKTFVKTDGRRHVYLSFLPGRVALDGAASSVAPSTTWSGLLRSA